jgi:anaerobic magnesium-protoporphyrin IX monomethyl ester cyclase
MKGAPLKNKTGKQLLIISGIPPVDASFLVKGNVGLSTELYRLFNDGPVHNSMPSLGAVIMATEIMRHGYQVTVKDWYLDKIDFTPADIVGISAANFGLEDITAIAEAAKKADAKRLVVLGGPISWSYSPEYLFEAMPNIDYIVFGEGERTFVEFLESLYNGKENLLYRIPGLLYRNDTRSQQEKIRPKISAREFPVPNWGIIDRSKMIRLLPVETARGCPYKCQFCSERTYWDTVRYKDADAIVAEIKSNIKNFGTTVFRIADSCFSAPVKRCRALCKRLASEFTCNEAIRWSSFARVDNLQDIATLKDMKDAGCVALDIGMESGDAQVLKNMNKGYSPEMIIRAVTNAKTAGIFTHCNVVVGFPGESKKSISNTIDILNSAKPDSYHCMLFDVAPNTLISKNASRYNLVGTRLQWEHSTMTNTQAVVGMNKIIKNVLHSCLMPMGELVAIFLTAQGHSFNQISMFFNNIRSGTISDKDIAMLNSVLRKNKLITQ